MKILDYLVLFKIYFTFKQIENKRNNKEVFAVTNIIRRYHNKRIRR